jgi:hypothetical protein
MARGIGQGVGRVKRGAAGFVEIIHVRATARRALIGAKPQSDWPQSDWPQPDWS